VLHQLTLSLALLLSPRPAERVPATDTTRICLAPASVEASVGDASIVSISAPAAWRSVGTRMAKRPPSSGRTCITSSWDTPGSAASATRRMQWCAY
jgi:hypothetical protein